jgi:hypothetical protein
MVVGKNAFHIAGKYYARSFCGKAEVGPSTTLQSMCSGLFWMVDLALDPMRLWYTAVPQPNDASASLAISDLSGNLTAAEFKRLYPNEALGHLSIGFEFVTLPITAQFVRQPPSPSATPLSEKKRKSGQT